MEQPKKIQVSVEVDKQANLSTEAIKYDLISKLSKELANNEEMLLIERKDGPYRTTYYLQLAVVTPDVTSIINDMKHNEVTIFGDNKFTKNELAWAVRQAFPERYL